MGVRCFNHETIYRYIWRDKKKGGLLWKRLRCAKKRRRKRYKANSRGKIANKRNIADRPAEVETCETLGRWETGTVIETKHCIVTFLEKKTDYAMIGKLNDLTTKSINRRMIKSMIGK
ncbi:MAG: IS30 family transposase [Candidatus Endonucleobacter sp. (ex Gigantidas childressi)]|nr:IS30 family transposase [Candidatus Endonucleobacter sp. (ex Gigantidas childressi)]